LKDWKRGLLLTLFSIVLWGAQPIAIAVVGSIPSSALAFYKIFSAAFALVVFLLATKQFPDFRLQSTKSLAFLILASGSLTLSSIFFNASFKFVSPSNVQIYFQLSRIFMALGGVFVFRESFLKIQWLGLFGVCAGLYLFFYDQLELSQNGELYHVGVLLVIGSALAWASYAIFQKLLLSYLSATQILVFIYLFSTVLLARYAALGPLANLRLGEWLAVAFICISNVLAFVFFSLSLKYWDSSRIAAISCLTPIVTVCFMFLFADLGLKIGRPENLGINALLGALTAIVGSILVAFYGQAKIKDTGKRSR
jgi:drug/metabolite transporter (DMT)-like permease